MDYPKEQLKGEDRIGFQRSKAYDIFETFLVLLLLVLCILVPVNKAISDANYQQSMKNFCADYTNTHNATPIPMPGLFVCDGSSTGISAGNGCLYVLAIIGIIILLVMLVQTVRRLTRPGLYTFDRRNNSFSLDGQELAKLSNIKEVKIKQVRATFSLNIVYADGNSERLSTFWSSGAANDAADQIANFIGVPKTHGWAFF